MPVEKVELSDKTIYLVGTAHVSDESVKQVKAAIEEYDPDLVAVELCEQRHKAIRDEKKWDETEIGQVLASGKIYLLLLQIMLTNFQKKIGEEGVIS